MNHCNKVSKFVKLHQNQGRANILETSILETYLLSMRCTVQRWQDSYLGSHSERGRSVVVDKRKTQSKSERSNSNTTIEVGLNRSSVDLAVIAKGSTYLVG